MKSYQITLVALLLSSSSFAGVSFKGEATTPIPTYYNWTGLYAGFNIGALNHTLDMTDVEATSFNATIQQVSNPKFTGGLQIGYRQQINFTHTSGVYGLELSSNFSNALFKKHYGSDFALYDFNVKHELKNATLLQLTGGIASDRTLLFLAAGLSWTSITGHVNSLNGAPFFNSFSVSKNQWGTAVGVGLEHACTENISLRFKVDMITPNTYTTSNETDSSFLIANHIVEATLGLNYKFA